MTSPEALNMTWLCNVTETQLLINNEWERRDTFCITSELHSYSWNKTGPCSSPIHCCLDSSARWHQRSVLVERLINTYTREITVHIHSITFASSLEWIFTLRMHKFVGFVAIMHYNSYVPELDLKPVQFVFDHQVSIIIIHIPTLKQKWCMLHIYRPMCDGCNTVKGTDSTPYTMSCIAYQYCILKLYLYMFI